MFVPLCRVPSLPFSKYRLIETVASFVLFSKERGHRCQACAGARMVYLGELFRPPALVGQIKIFSAEMYYVPF